MPTPQEIARRAKEIMEDEVFLSVFADLEERFTADWRNSQPADTQKRETAWSAIRVLGDIKSRLHSMANAPKVEAHNNRNAAKR
jgi:hypothetical protein